MKTDLHLGFMGNCDAAFTFYEGVFGAKRTMTMKWKDAPVDMATPPEAADLIMHTSLPLGSIQLMGADAPPGRGKPLSGFEISLTVDGEGELKRLLGELSDGGSVTMAPGPTFWTPLFAMCTDKFGVSWMLSLPGNEM